MSLEAETEYGGEDEKDTGHRDDLKIGNFWLLLAIFDMMVTEMI